MTFSQGAGRGVKFSACSSLEAPSRSSGLGRGERPVPKREDAGTRYIRLQQQDQLYQSCLKVDRVLGAGCSPTGGWQVLSEPPVEKGMGDSVEDCTRSSEQIQSCVKGCSSKMGNSIIAKIETSLEELFKIAGAMSRGREGATKECT